MAKATIDRGDGTKITVDLTDEQVARIAEVIEGCDAQAPAEKRKRPPETTKKKPTIKSLICELMNEGFFPVENSGAKGRSIEEIGKALQRKGYKYKTTSLSGRLQDLVRDDVLHREGDARKYAYFQPK